MTRTRQIDGTSLAGTVNAWIFLGEDEPKGTNYQSSTSCYQALINQKVYNYVDLLFVCFVDTAPTSSATVPTGDGSSYTIDVHAYTHPNNITSVQYLNWIVRDAHSINPNIRILATLGYRADEFSQIFSGSSDQWAQQAADYAANVLLFLRHYGLDGLDVDWEPNFCNTTTQQQFALVFSALNSAFEAAPKTYYLTMCPSQVGNLDADTVNATCNLVSLQCYGGASSQEFTDAGVNSDIIAYGAKFETDSDKPYEDAPTADYNYNNGSYTAISQWRLNSDDFQYEQSQQMSLYQLVNPETPPCLFDDSPIAAAAGNPSISTINLYVGEILDSIQALSAGEVYGNSVTYTMPPHGGYGGTATTITLESGDAIVEVSGYTGVWFGWSCIAQISFTTRNGTTYGPYGDFVDVSIQLPFTMTAQEGQSLVAFSGSVIVVPESGGSTSAIVGSLNAHFA